MKIIIDLTILSNIIAICILGFGLFHKFENPKHKAIFGYSIAGSMALYLIMLLLVCLSEFSINHNCNSLFLIFFIISPFIIGKLVKFETLKKFTVIQILSFWASLMFLILVF